MNELYLEVVDDLSGDSYFYYEEDMNDTLLYESVIDLSQMISEMD